MTGPLHLAGLTFEPHAWGRPRFGVTVRTGGRGPAAAFHVLGAEPARQLAAWLLAAVGAAPAPADPDAVRSAIDAQRAVLAQRSAHPDTTEEARAELAWASRALDTVAAAAGACTPEDR